MEPLDLVAQSLVVTCTVVPLVVTLMAVFTATACVAVRVSGSAAAAATVRPERTSIWVIRIELPSDSTVGGTSHAPPRIGNARAPSDRANARITGSARGPGPGR